MGSLLACLAAGVAGAQDKPADNMEILREKVRADKKVVVASVLALTESEAKVFWPVYNAYQGDMVSHYDRVLKLIDTYAKAYDTMTDETATTLLTRPWRSSAITSRCSIRTLPASERCSRPKRSRACTRSRTRSGHS